MLGENIRILRKQKGYSQETLAQRLNVVRQTISKWEKGLSVPDAEMLRTIAEILEVPVSTLLGNTLPEKEAAARDDQIDEIAKQLALLNEQMALQTVRRKKTVQCVILVLLAVCFLFVAVSIAFRMNARRDDTFRRTRIECLLDGETYSYELLYDRDFRILDTRGDDWIDLHVQPDRFGRDARIWLRKIEEYMTARGGTIRIIAEEE